MTKYISIALLLSVSFLSSQCSANDDVETLTPLVADTTTHPVDTPSIPSKNLNYLALGDSYTIGTGVGPSERFPIQLKQRLIADGFMMTDPLIIATNGWTTASLIAATDNFKADSAFNLVSLLIGVNNQYQGRPIGEYETHFMLLLNRAISYAGGDTSRVFVVSIPDYSVTPFGQSLNPAKIAAEIDIFNEVNRNITESLGVSYHYITDISRLAADSSELVANDNLHPSGVQYALWIDSFYESVKLSLYE